MTTPNDAGRDFGTSDCSSAFESILQFLEMENEMAEAQHQADAVDALLRGHAQLITVVCGEDRETAIYLNGELQEREDSNDAYEIARITKSLPCQVTTRNPVGWQCGRDWPKRLLDIPNSACQHAIAVDEDGVAVCAYCGKDFGWYCYISTKHFCEYAGDELCIHCGAPEERQ